MANYKSAYTGQEIDSAIGKANSALQANSLKTINGISIVGSGDIVIEDGRGIVSIEKTSTEGLIDTYTITYTDDTTSTFNVRNGANGKDGTNGQDGKDGADGKDGKDGKDGTNGQDGKDGADGQDGEDGRGIVSILKTGTSGLVDTYTITYTDNTTSTFTVTNGEGGGQALSFANGIEKEGNTVILPKTDDVAFAISDSQGNSVFIVDNNGDIDFKLSEALKTKIRSIDDYEFDADVYMVPCVGQSLAINTGAGASSFSGTEPLSYNTSLTNTNLQDMNSGFCEAFRLAASHHHVNIPSTFKIITCVVGTGGTSINTFGKGTNHYTQVMNNIRTAWNACQNAGLRMIVPRIYVDTR